MEGPGGLEDPEREAALAPGENSREKGEQTRDDGHEGEDGAGSEESRIVKVADGLGIVLGPVVPTNVERGPGDFRVIYVLNPDTVLELEEKGARQRELER